MDSSIAISLHLFNHAKSVLSFDHVLALFRGRVVTLLLMQSFSPLLH